MKRKNGRDAGRGGGAADQCSAAGRIRVTPCTWGLWGSENRKRRGLGAGGRSGGSPDARRSRAGHPVARNRGQGGHESAERGGAHEKKEASPSTKTAAPVKSPAF